MSVKQNLFVSVFVHECLMMLNDVEYTTFKMFVTQMNNYLVVISFKLMFYKTLFKRNYKEISAHLRDKHFECCIFNIVQHHQIFVNKD